MEDYFQCVWDLLPFWQENRHKRASEPPCKNAEFYQIEEALYGMSGSVVAFFSLAVGWQVIKFIWRRFTKQQGQVKQEIDKEELFRTLCIDAHVAELYKLKTKKWKQNSNDNRRVRKMIRELNSKLRKAHHKEKKHIRRLKRLQKKKHDSPDKNILAKMAELEKRLQGAVHEKEGLTGLLLAAEEKYMARDRNAQEYWFALQMVGRQIQDIKHEASTLRTRLKAFEPHSPRSIQGWAPSAAIYSHLRQPRRNGTEATVRVRKTQSSPSTSTKQSEGRVVPSVVRDVTDGGAAPSETLPSDTSNEGKAEADVTHGSWTVGVTPDRIPLAAQEHLRMRMEGLPPTFPSASLQANRGDFGNANGNAIDTTTMSDWPFPDDCQIVAPPPAVWALPPKPLMVRISPKIEQAAGDQKSPKITADKVGSIAEQGRPEAANADSPRTISASGPTSPLTAYMYPIMDLLGSDIGGHAHSSTPPPSSQREQTSPCQNVDTGNTAATDDVETPNVHSETDTPRAYVTDDKTALGVPEEGARRRHYQTKRSRIPPPRVFSC